jgi:hypothetical protein
LGADRRFAAPILSREPIQILDLIQDETRNTSLSGPAAPIAGTVGIRVTF